MEIRTRSHRALPSIMNRQSTHRIAYRLPSKIQKFEMISVKSKSKADSRCFQQINLV